MVIQITKEFVSPLLPQRKQESNKGTYGKVLNIAGCLNYQGAAYLSSVSALKIGAGLVTLATAEPVVNNLASACPWVTFLPLDNCEGVICESSFSKAKDYIDNYNVVSVGSGLSCEKQTAEFTRQVIEYLCATDKKSVIDADALNNIAALNIEKLPSNSVITPHPMELSRLIKVSVEEIQKDRIKYAKYAVEKFGCNVILKGNKTVIGTTEGDIFVNTSGCSALAKAGSGDVLTGMIAGLIAQGAKIADAAVLGVYLHGLCGEICAEQLTQYCVLATDQIDAIPQAVKQVLKV